jgi:hypothetical protein
MLGLEIIENRFREAFRRRSYSDPMTLKEAMEAWKVDPSSLQSGHTFAGMGIAGKGRPLPILILTKELDLGDPGIKWFRRFTMVGKGVCNIRITLDSRLVMESRVTLEHFVGGTKWLSFARGTMGRRIRLEIWGDVIQIQNPLIEWEPYGSNIPFPNTKEG